MINYDSIIEAQTALVEHWGEDGKRVIEECAKSTPLNMPFKDFLANLCTCCGGNWGGMILTGIRRAYESVYNAIPAQMGTYAFVDLCYVCLLCGIDTTAEEE